MTTLQGRDDGSDETEIRNAQNLSVSLTKSLAVPDQIKVARVPSGGHSDFGRWDGRVACPVHFTSPCFVDWTGRPPPFTSCVVVYSRLAHAARRQTAMLLEKPRESWLETRPAMAGLRSPRRVSSWAMPRE